jgi:hypothetical protein
MGALASRFIEFCRSVPGAEEVDALALTSEQKALKLKSADFLFDNRSIICEIKSLETDTAWKFTAFLKQQGFELPPGEYSVQQLFSTKPNGQELFQKASSIVATSVADGLADANRQIRDTKKLLGISAADGVVVILNGMVEVLGPQLVIKRILERLDKLADDGTPYYSHVALILYFSEKHLRESAAGDAAVAFPIRNEGVPALTDLNAVASKFVKGWAEFNGRWYDEQAFDLWL